MRRRNLAVLLLGLAGMLMAGDQAGSPASTLAQAPERRVIFVQGMDSEANCQPNDNLQSVANYLVGHSDGLLSNDDFLGFSYSGSYCSPDPTSEFPNYTPDYSSDFTCGSIDPADGGLGHSQRFGTWFRSLPADGTTYDIVAHSMGGVVVAYWVTELASAEDLAKLHAVITLDSPLLGIAEWQEWAARLRSALGFARCTALDNRYSDMDDDSPVIAAIGNAETVERTPFVTIRNQPDLVVPPDIAYLAGAWLDRLLDDPCDGLIGTNHGCVFTNDVALGTILVAVQQAGETPGEATTGDWPMFGHDPGVTHFNAAEEELTPPLSMFWSVDGLAQGQWPVVSQGVLYIEARFGDLVAIDATTGEL
ncbi:MAG: hypothetical protein IH865_11105, partial [Chloroflexi bacterium]|nr:hypothetical protein [Chloroflexota bacterium]